MSRRCTALIAPRHAMQALRFRCLPGCTNCCRTRGFVYLTEEDVLRAAARLGLSKHEFETRYVFRTRHLMRLRVPRGRYCPFLLPHGCLLHPDKPLQCRSYPFWPELIESKREWHKLARFCPGVGRGALVSLQAIQRIANRMRESFPTIYGAQPADASLPRTPQSSVPRRTKLAIEK